MIHYIKGDVIKALETNKITSIAHQCNCTVGMSNGVAKVINNKFDGIHLFDKNIRELDNPIGTSHKYKIDRDKTIYNMYSQYYPGPPSSKLFNYKLALSIYNDYRFGNLEVPDSHYNRINILAECLKQIKDDVSANNIKLGIPLIASGLGADKSLKRSLSDLEYFKQFIDPIVKDIFKEVDIYVYYL